MATDDSSCFLWWISKDGVWDQQLIRVTRVMRWQLVDDYTMVITMVTNLAWFEWLLRDGDYDGHGYDGWKLFPAVA